MTREEHLQWCKDRALEYANAGDNQSALASMLSDLGKHAETAGAAKIGGTLGMSLLIGGHLSTQKQMVDFINGFN
jgi:hypothetical protein